jgi:hypothetical protein
MGRPSAGALRDLTRWVDHSLGISWKVARRQVFEPVRGQPDDGRRQVLTVDRILPGGPAAENKLVVPGDKLVTVDVQGNGAEIMVARPLADLRSAMEGLDAAQQHRRPQVVLELMRATDACASQYELNNPAAVGRRPTTCVTLQVAGRGLKPVRPPSRRQPSASGGARARTPAGLPAGAGRPASRSAALTPGGGTRPRRPPTTSWQIPAPSDSPQATRALNASRFERLLFFVNRRLRDPALVDLLNRSYAIDRPKTGAGGPAAGPMAGSPAAALRACYRLRVWWTSAQQAAVERLLARARASGGVAERLGDALEVLREHLAAARAQRPPALAAPGGAPGGRAEILRLDDDEPAARGAGAGVGGADAAARAAAHSLVDEVLLSVLASCER